MECNEDHNIGVDGDDVATTDEGEAAAHEDLHLHSSFFCNRTTKGTGGGVWMGTGRAEEKIKRKLIPVLPRTRAKMALQKNGTHGTATGTLCRVSGVGSCHPTDEPATAKHQSLCSSGANLLDKRKNDKKGGKRAP